MPELTLLLLALIWGGTFLATRTILREVGPFTLLALRFGLGAGTLGLVLGRRWRPSREEWRLGAVVGVVVALAYGGQTIALRTVASSASAFLTASGVPLVAVFQTLLMRRGPSPRVWAAAGIAAAGVALLAIGPGFRFALGAGELLTLGAAVAGALQVVLVGRWGARFDPLRFTMVGLLVVAGLAAPLALFEAHPAPSGTAAGLVLLMGTVATGGALGLMTWAQRSVEPSRAVLIYALEPVFAGIVGRLAGESLGPWAFVGGGLVAGAAVLGEWPERGRAPEGARPEAARPEAARPEAAQG